MGQIRDFLKNHLSVPKDWDKHDYKIQRYSFEDIEDCIISFIDKEVSPEIYKSYRPKKDK